jgi:hypothetical protein
VQSVTRFLKPKNIRPEETDRHSFEVYEEGVLNEAKRSRLFKEAGLMRMSRKGVGA